VSVRVLASTFGPGDAQKVLMAMRSLPYDKLMLIGEEDAQGSPDAAHLVELESLSGHEVEFKTVEPGDFVTMVNEIAGAISQPQSSLVLNISGGTKLLANAALLAAFRTGVPAYYVDSTVVKLPVIRGMSARDMFTPLQREMISAIQDGCSLKSLAEKMSASSIQSVERTMRELRKMGIAHARLDDGEVLVLLTDRGREVARTIDACGQPSSQ